MASIKKDTNPSGTKVWRVYFHKKNKETKKTFFKCYTFLSEEEAKSFAEKWEPVFIFKGHEHVPYDREMERLKRRFPDYVKNNP